MKREFIVYKGYPIEFEYKDGYINLINIFIEEVHHELGVHFIYLAEAKAFVYRYIDDPDRIINDALFKALGTDYD